eukprot:2874220-Rhodomonas_salina.5
MSYQYQRSTASVRTNMAYVRTIPAIWNQYAPPATWYQPPTSVHRTSRSRTDTPSSLSFCRARRGTSCTFWYNAYSVAAYSNQHPPKILTIPSIGHSRMKKSPQNKQKQKQAYGVRAYTHRFQKKPKTALVEEQGGPDGVENAEEERPDEEEACFVVERARDPVVRDDQPETVAEILTVEVG